MQEIQYIGEHLWPKYLGHGFIVTAFVSALFAIISYIFHIRKPEEGWLRYGRIFFSAHLASIFLIIGLLFFIMLSQWYEYSYVWEHVSDSLPLKYIFSAFWEGQEGSFLLWMFWHVVLGAILIRTAGKWEAPVLVIVSLVQLVLVSMILGIYVGESFKLGSNPFLLLRDTMEAPIFNQTDYLSKIDGNGLNPLLQNYWMTIHPPTLFLGFASTLVPFSYAIAGLWTKQYRDWLKPALRWALFSAGILGTGILMGGAWAYEALSFGGYWAWDPVENMSLVPWIIMIAGLHTNLIARNTGHSIKPAIIFYMLSFVLVLYSTFLTRSGILGESSVHAFTEMGLEWQLVGFILLFNGLSLYFIIKEFRNVPVPEKEERIESREFWMFIGSLVLVFSAILISFTTSIPVYNKLFDVVGNIFNTDLSGWHRSTPVEPIPHYNKYQLWIAVVIALISSFAQFMRYRESRWNSYAPRLLKHAAISALVGGLLFYFLTLWINTYAWQFAVLLIAAAFAVMSNIDYLVTFLRFNLKAGASAIAHFGFAVMLIGIITSGLNKQIISSNRFAQEGLVDGIDAREHITLIKGVPMYMEGYWVEYTRDTVIGNMRKFEVTYSLINEKTGEPDEQFVLYPNVLYNNQFTKIEASNPDTKHFASKDIFTYVSSLPASQMDIEAAKTIEDSLKYQPYRVFPGDTVTHDEAVIELVEITNRPINPEYHPQPGDLVLGAVLKVTGKSIDTHFLVNPMIVLRQNLVYHYPAQINTFNIRIKLMEEAISAAYLPRSELHFDSISLKQGERHLAEDYTITLRGIERQPYHPDYEPRKGDIAVNAILDVQSGGKTYSARPLFLIRNDSPSNYKAVVPEIGLHVHFMHIDPIEEAFSFLFAKDPRTDRQYSIAVASDVPRDDLIVMQAMVFPGINLFWAGSILMMLGFFLALYRRLSKRKTS